MKKLLTITFLCLQFSSFAFDEGSDKIIKKYLKAIGGAKEWEKINSMKIVMEGDRSYSEIITTISILRDKGYKQETVYNFKNETGKDIQGGTPSVYAWYNDETAWSVANLSLTVGDVKKDSTIKVKHKEWGLNQIIDKANDKNWIRPLRWQTQIPWCFIDYETKGYTTTYKGDTKISVDGVSEIEMISPTGDTTSYFFDKKKATLLKAKFKRKEYSYAGYKQVDNVKIAFEITEAYIDGISKGVAMTKWFTVNQIKLNEPMDEKIFLKPKQ
jgi:hypothetical protein